jgi:signal transduction histidine kinase/CheY-like chemotaxis protein
MAEPQFGDASLLWTLEEIGHLVSHSGDASETLTNIVLLIQQRFLTDVCSVYLLESDRASLVLAATVGLHPDGVGKVRMRLDEGLVGLVAEELKPQVVAEATTHPRFKYFPDAGEDLYHSFVGVPIVERAILQGVLVVQTIESRLFSDNEVRMLMTAGNQLAPIVGDARTERRRAQQGEIVQRAKSELVETLAGGIAHELNNKLMPVVGFAELLIAEADRMGSQRLHEYGETIHASALEAAQIIRQLLQLSKPLVDDQVACDFRDIIQQALTLVRLRLQESGINLTVDLPDYAVTVKVDPGQLKQVFVNLVWNAIDSMEHAETRELTVRLTVAGGMATLSCIDRGHGIPPERLLRIFDPFFTTKEPSRGTGLGLSVCLAIVKQAGGDIRVQSTVGAGTAFHVVVPAQGGAAAAPDVPAARPARETQPRQAPRGLRVLVIDDEDPVARVVARALTSKLGCLVECARNGQEALAALQRTDFALVLSDIRMPSMNGVEFLEWLTAHRPDLLQKTVFMTGDGRSSELNAHIERAGHPVLRKPFTLDALLKMTSGILAPS